MWIARKVGPVSFHHHDPYATLSDVVRGFDRDLADAERFVSSGMVAPDRLKDLVHGISDEAWAKYPALSRDAVLAVVDGFVQRVSGGKR